MKKIFSIFLVFISFNSFSSVKFWEQIRQGKIDQFHRKMINLSGEVILVKRHLKSRDTFYIIDVKDPKGKNTVRIRLFTVKKFKKINEISCKEGQKFFARVKFMRKIKTEQVGFIEVDSKNFDYKCFTPTKKE